VGEGKESIVLTFSLLERVHIYISICRLDLANNVIPVVYFWDMSVDKFLHGFKSGMHRSVILFSRNMLLNQ
jgi:hypothetical protein